MVPASLSTEARRWVKFPATVLLATALLWLLHNIFNYDQAVIGQRAETFVGAVSVFCELVVIPLGSVAVAVGMLWLQRWGLALGYVMPLLPLTIITLEKVQRIAWKFAEHRAGSWSSFGDGVMTALLLVALWAMYVLIVCYIIKSWRVLNLAQDWLHSPAKPGAGHRLVNSGQPAAGNVTEDGDYCLIMPESGPDEPA